MQTIESIKSILYNTAFNFFGKDFKFEVVSKGDGFLLKLLCYTNCNNTGKIDWQSGGKFYISSHAINDEVVLTAWKACQDYVIHEAREAFTYKNQTIFQPHYSMEELANFCSQTTPVSRPKSLIQQHLDDVKTAQDIDH